MVERRGGRLCSAYCVKFVRGHDRFRRIGHEVDVVSCQVRGRIDREVFLCCTGLVCLDVQVVYNTSGGMIVVKSKAEKNVEKAFEELGVKPYVYHIREYGEHRRRLSAFEAVTVATAIKRDPKELADMIGELDQKCESDYVCNPATWMRKQLADRGLFGIAICDGRDQFSRKRGRIIAEGRLLKKGTHGFN